LIVNISTEMYVFTEYYRLLGVLDSGWWTYTFRARVFIKYLDIIIIFSTWFDWMDEQSSSPQCVSAANVQLNNDEMHANLSAFNSSADLTAFTTRWVECSCWLTIPKHWDVEEAWWFLVSFLYRAIFATSLARQRHGGRRSEIRLMSIFQRLTAIHNTVIRDSAVPSCRTSIAPCISH
jgi:hypothetical protein